MEDEIDLPNKIGLAVIKATVEACRGDDGTAVVSTAAALDGLIMAASVMLAQDPALNTPQKVRLITNEVATKLCQQILAAQADPTTALLFSSGTLN